MEWISVKDKLPGYGKTVLFAYGGKVYCGSSGPSDTGVMFYGDVIGEPFSYSRFLDPDHISDITHWMPLPEPPKE